MHTFSKEFSTLLEVIAKELDIPESYFKQAVERYESIGEWLERDKSIVTQFRPEIYPQGSFLLGTVTKPVSDLDEYDLDFVSELKSLEKTPITQEQLKNLVGDEIKSYANSHNIKSPVKESKRCWTLSYADRAKFHIDILPSIPDEEAFKQLLKSSGYSPSHWTDTAIAITDNTHPNYNRIHPDWTCSNPKGYAEWFRSRMQTQYDAVLKSLMEKLVDEVPEYEIKTPLQQGIQILKRHRDIWFDQYKSRYDEDAKPISIIITTLAALAYNNEADLQDAIWNIVSNMHMFIARDINGKACIPNPVNPLENFADKWQEHPIRETCFFDWLKQIQEDFRNIFEQSNVHNAGELLKPCLGKGVVNAALRDSSTSENLIAYTATANTYQEQDRFNVSHRQAPTWTVMPNGQVKILGTVHRKGFRSRQIKSDSTPLPKYHSLQFKAQTNIEMPYEVYWQIVNTGAEASKANGLRGGFCSSTSTTNGHIRKEETRYRGMHWIECFIVKNDICQARSGEFIVNIE